jgi:alpha-tubulin suppressor-like RCC1 family protein
MLFEKLLPAIVKTTPITTGVPYVWGNNANFGLGLGFAADYGGNNIPASTATLAIWGIATGSYNGGTACTTIIIIKQDGTMWGWGTGNSGQLGNNQAGDLTFFQKLNTSTNWALVTMGDGGSALATKTDGTLWAWGYNGAGQLGLNIGNINKSSPTQVGALTNWPTSDYRKICCGNGSTAIVKSDGTLWTFGNNDYGQLGLNDIIRRSSPVQVGAGTNWKYVSSMNQAFVAVKTDGTLWSWGNNDYWQLGQGNLILRSSPVQIGALTTWASVGPGYGGGFAIKTDGTLWAWGSNAVGVLGIGTSLVVSSPTQVGADTNWSSVFVGAYDSNARTQIFVKTNGTAYLTGTTINYIDNKTIYTYRSSPVQVGSLTNIAGALYGYNTQPAGKGTESVYGCILTKTNSGANVSGIGDNYGNYSIYNMPYAPVPILFETTTKWKYINVSPYNGSGVKSNGTLWTWGNNAYGQLGLNNVLWRSSPVQVGALTNWKVTLSLTSLSTIALKTDGTLWAWGRNQYGEVDPNIGITRSSPIQIGALTTWSQIAGTSASILAIKTNGTLWAWGDGSFGTLGLGNVNPQSSPTQVGALTTWSQIACSTSSFGIKTDGTLWAWGLNSFGTLGLGNVVSKSSPVQVGALTNWASVVTGQDSTIALKTDGTLWAWGYNSNGMLGIGNSINKSSPVQVGTLTTWASIGIAGGSSGTLIAIKKDGTMWASGYYANGTENPVNSPVQISSGETTAITWFNPGTSSAATSAALKA